jgi:hypothetical protein
MVAAAYGVARIRQQYQDLYRTALLEKGWLWPDTVEPVEALQTF